MIEFRCLSCGSSYSVPDNRAGSRGKCPRCGNIMEVPIRSESEFIFDESELSCEDPKMQRLYDGIVGTLSSKIVQHRILEEDRLLFELYIESGRTQIVVCSKIYDGVTKSDQLLIWSEVGTVYDDAGAIAALRVGSQHPRVSAALNDDYLLSVRAFVELSSSVENLWAYLMLVAIAADVLEDTLFCWDRV